jgi:hypothetical protein
MKIPRIPTTGIPHIHGFASRESEKIADPSNRKKFPETKYQAEISACFFCAINKYYSTVLAGLLRSNPEFLCLTVPVFKSYQRDFRFSYWLLNSEFRDKHPGG